jgi:hypothetical protein
MESGVNLATRLGECHRILKVRRIRGRWENSKTQIPNPKQIPNLKVQIPTTTPRATRWSFGIWILDLLGFWDLEFSVSLR